MITITLLAGLAVSASACTQTGAGGNPSAGTEGSPATIVAAFYPLAEAAQRMGGDCVTVQNLTPPGVEPHDLELNPSEMVSISQADGVLYLGGGFQPAVEDALGDVTAPSLDVLAEVAQPVAPAEGQDEGVTLDPHFWLSPQRFAEVVPAIGGLLAEAAPNASCDFAEGAARFQADLQELDAEYRDGLASCERDLIVTNHAAFGYLAADYDLTQESITGIEPDAEPTPGRIANLRDLVEREGVTTIFTEELVSPKVAQTLATEAGVDTAQLLTLEGLTDEQLAAGFDYGAGMRENLAALQEALGCA